MEELLQICEKQLAPFEGLRQHIYKDTRGNETIGYGHLVSNGFSPAVCKLMFDEDIQIAITGCKEKIHFFDGLNPARQYVLINLAFNMGVEGLMGFHKMLACMLVGSFTEAAQELSNSLENQEVPNRIHPLIKILETGTIDP